MEDSQGTMAGQALLCCDTRHFSRMMPSIRWSQRLPVAVVLSEATSTSKKQHLLDEDLTQAGLAARVVLQVEFVEPVEDVFVRVHVQRVDVEVVPAALHISQ